MKSREKGWRYGLRAGISILLVVCLCVCFIQPWDNDVYATTSLPNIEKIISSQSSYTVLEIVPKAGEGVLGYYVNGYEPCADWRAQVAALSGGNGTTQKAVRKAYIDQRFGDLTDAGLLGPASQAPLTPAYTPYYTEEFYWERNGSSVGYLPIDLAREETVSVRGVFRENVDRTGAYQADRTFAVSEDRNGDFEQNILYFEAGNHGGDRYYYSPTFEEVVGSAVTLEGKAIYLKEEGSGGFVSQGILGSSQLPGLYIDPDVVYYYVSDTGRASDTYSNDYSYAAYADGFSPVQNGRGTFHSALTGTWQLRPGLDGDYDFAYDPSGPAAGDIRYQRVFVQSGFTNNNWFLRHVFDQDPDQTNLRVIVNSVTADRVTAAQIQAADLIYLSAGFDSADPGPSAASYSGANDLSAAAQTAMTAAISTVTDGVVTLTKPFIVDYALSNSSTDSDMRAAARSALSAAELSGTQGVAKNRLLFNGATIKVGGSAVLGLATAEFAEQIDSSTAASFNQVLTEITNQNFVRRLDNIDPLPTTVSLATSIRHIINFSGVATSKNRIEVLEIQPRYRSDLTTGHLSESTVAGWVDLTANDVHITTMSTYEFIGRIEDLNETYDLIYFGDSTAGFKMLSGKTVYNDDKMNGLLYSGIGDSYRSQQGLVGMLDTDYNIQGTYNQLRVSAEASCRWDETVENIPTTVNVTVTYDSYKDNRDRYYLRVQVAPDNNNYSVTYQWRYANGTNVNNANSYRHRVYDGTDYSCAVTITHLSSGQSVTINTPNFDWNTRGGTRMGNLTYTTQQTRYTYTLSARLTDAPDGATVTYEWHTGYNYGTSVGTGSSQSYSSTTAGQTFRCRATVKYGPDTEVLTISGLTGANSPVSQEGYINGLEILEETGRTLKNDADATTFRLSGNDITESKATALKNYIRAGYPIVLANSLAVNSRVADGINGERIDNSSILYDTLNDIRGVTNLMSVQEAVANKVVLKDHLNLSKPRILMDEADMPTIYENDDGVMNSMAAEDDNSLIFDFSIENATDPTPATTTYDCRLYIDTNADGRYTETELLKDAVIRMGGKNGVLMVPDDDGVFALSADVQYTMVRQMPAEFTGIIPWKLEVVKNGAEHIHTSVHNYTRIAPKAGIQATTINVLQISSGHAPYLSGGSGGVINLQEQQKTVTGYQTKYPEFKSSVTNEYYKGIYGKLLADVVDFNVVITTESTSVLNARGTQEQIFNYLNGYDMLIIGFADCYQELSENAANAVVGFIDTQKSVLFTHDTTSFTNADNRAYPSIYSGVTGPSDKWGYYFNSILRDPVSLDRYGVRSQSSSESVSGALNKLSAGVGSTLSDAEEEALLAEGYSVAYKPKTARETLLDEVQGYTSHALAEYAYPSRANNVNTYEHTDFSYNYGNRNTPYLTQVNEGQLTTYPYNINTKPFDINADPNLTDDRSNNDGDVDHFMEVTETHSQYYQLNLNSDDIVVWYCLAGGYVNGDIHNDVVNANYIYSRGNITYSGVGHNNSGQSDYTEPKGNFDRVQNEAKLFVNTMIAAYQSKVEPPIVTITADRDGLLDMPVKYYSLDNWEAGGAFLNADEDTGYFNITDPNLTSEEKRITAAYTYTVGNGTTVKTFSGNSATKYEAGQPYAIDLTVPLRDLALTGTTHVTVTVTVSETIAGVTMTASDSVQLRKLGLFDVN